MSINPMKAHAESLKRTNHERYVKFRQALEEHGETVYFDHTLCRTANATYNLKQVRFIVAELVCEFFPNFSHTNFKKNEFPPIPVLKERDLAHA